MQKFIFTGNLTRDPELTQTASGVSVCRFTVAVSRPQNADGEKLTDFFDCTAWRGLADIISKYCAKGKKVLVVGRVQIRKWTDKNGNERTTPEVIADDVEFLSPSDKQNTPQGKHSNLQSFDDDGDIPF